jgi:hypothetical protein
MMPVVRTGSKGAAMSITLTGLDAAKSVFQVHTIGKTGKAMIGRELQTSELIPFFEKQEACAVVMTSRQRLSDRS